MSGVCRKKPVFSPTVYGSAYIYDFKTSYVGTDCSHLFRKIRLKDQVSLKVAPDDLIFRVMIYSDNNPKAQFEKKMLPSSLFTQALISKDQIWFEQSKQSYRLQLIPTPVRPMTANYLGNLLQQEADDDSYELIPFAECVKTIESNPNSSQLSFYAKKDIPEGYVILYRDNGAGQIFYALSPQIKKLEVGNVGPVNLDIEGLKCVKCEYIKGEVFQIVQDEDKMSFKIFLGDRKAEILLDKNVLYITTYSELEMDIVSKLKILNLEKAKKFSDVNTGSESQDVFFAYGDTPPYTFYIIPLNPNGNSKMIDESCISISSVDEGGLIDFTIPFIDEEKLDPSVEITTESIQHESTVTKVKTKIVVHFDTGLNHALYLRGEGSSLLSWQEGTKMQNMTADSWVLEFEEADISQLKFKVLIDDDESKWEIGENHEIKPGDTFEITPRFS